MGSSLEDEYAAFREKVKRTVYFDNLSPQVTESVLRTALDQFATVKNVKLIPNYLEPRNVPQCALVELDSAKKAKEVITMIVQYPFMISGMPRPVRAFPAKAEMFDDRPKDPRRKLTCRWLEPGDPDFEVAEELKQLTRKHADEAAYLHQLQLQEEEKLSMHQEDTLKGHYKKYKMIESIMDGTAQRLARQYDMRVNND
ncbi:uncharacterized protein LOC129316225 [Prosopis cineraria]|uniref:uncharacterized protein LOC129316225 n=1 Tax=Prosopis cineraria TaxID=364024 RepID=UPI00241071C0|nr:uncharacterized protein LOC129316225 [Prosopis cineraria]